MNMPAGGRESPRTTEFESAGPGSALCQAGGTSLRTRRASGPLVTFSRVCAVAIDGAGVAVAAGVAAGVGAVVGAGVGAGVAEGAAVGAAPEQAARMLRAIEAARMGRFIGFSSRA